MISKMSWNFLSFICFSHGFKKIYEKMIGPSKYYLYKDASEKAFFFSKKILYHEIRNKI